MCRVFSLLFFFFFNDTATTEIYTLSLHDALPIYIVALAFEDRMRFDSEDDIEIAWGATARTDFTFTCDTHVDAIIHAGGDIDDHSAVVTHSTLATAFFARGSDDATFAAAALTHRHIDKMSKGGLVHATNLPRSLTGGTTGR